MVERAREDITGKTFGRWVVEGAGGKGKFRQWTWICRCSCGKRKRVSAQSLLSGNSLSCGCHKEDTSAVIFTKDETGKSYGHWTVLKYAYSDRSVYWLCECSCGVRKDVCGSDLRAGRTTGCGRCSGGSGAGRSVRAALRKSRPKVSRPARSAASEPDQEAGTSPDQQVAMRVAVGISRKE